MLIQLTGEAADRYREWLAYFERLDGHTTAETRTHSFFAALRGERPNWS